MVRLLLIGAKESQLANELSYHLRIPDSRQRILDVNRSAAQGALVTTDAIWSFCKSHWPTSVALLVAIVIGVVLGQRLRPTDQQASRRRTRPERDVVIWTAGVFAFVTIAFILGSHWQIEDKANTLQGIGSFFQASLAVGVAFAGAIVTIRLAQLGLQIVEREAQREQLKHAEDLLRDAVAPIQKLTKALSRYYDSCGHMESVVKLNDILAQRAQARGEVTFLSNNDFDSLAKCRSEITYAVSDLLNNTTSHFVWASSVQNRVAKGRVARHWGGEYSIERLVRLLDWLEKRYVFYLDAERDALKQYRRDLEAASCPSAQKSMFWAGQFLVNAQVARVTDSELAMTIATLVDSIPGPDDLMSILQSHLDLSGEAAASPSTLRAISFLCAAISPRNMLSRVLREDAASIVADPVFTAVPKFPWSMIDDYYLKGAQPDEPHS